jgi:hypothetical protein
MFGETVAVCCENTQIHSECKVQSLSLLKQLVPKQPPDLAPFPHLRTCDPPRQSRWLENAISLVASWRTFRHQVTCVAVRHLKCVDRIFTLISAAVRSAGRLRYLRPFEISSECDDVTTYRPDRDMNFSYVITSVPSEEMLLPHCSFDIKLAAPV